jgi:hypothetical protein
MGRESLLIDRYDVRSLLDDLVPFKRMKCSAAAEARDQDDLLADEERYLDLAAATQSTLHDAGTVPLYTFLSSTCVYVRAHANSSFARSRGRMGDADTQRKRRRSGGGRRRRASSVRCRSSIRRKRTARRARARVRARA